MLKRSPILLFLFTIIVFLMDENYSVAMPRENSMPDKLPVPVALLNIAIPEKLPSANSNVDMPRLSDFEAINYLLANETGNRNQFAQMPVFNELFKSKQFIWPVIGKISSGYGARFNRIHQGIDIPMPSGTPIMAASDGVVKRADSVLRGYGKLVIIDHGKGVETRYAHCSEFAVTKGDVVRAGQIIAYIGNTGNSTASHLHFEILMNGLAYNPMHFLGDYHSSFITQSKED